jgi:pimeloyl-ACP methyl ester carboxylesterase
MEAAIRVFPVDGRESAMVAWPMRNRFGLAILSTAFVLAPPAARAQDVGVVGTKLVIVDKIATTGKAKTVFVTKGDPDIAKGVDGDPALLEGTLEVFYTDEPTSVVGSFLIPAPWQVNKPTVAKYVNKLAPTGGDVKVAVVKPGTVAKVVAKGLGDGQAIDLSTAPGPGGVSVVFSINNGNDFSMHRLCTRFSTGDGSTIVYKSIAGGTGYKLVAKIGVGVDCPGTPFETLTTPSDAEPAETPGSPGASVTNPNLVTQFGSASFSLNNATYTRYRREGVTGQPDAILVLVPGFEGGATSFKILAENLIHRARTTAGLAVEVWAFDRRGQQLEDRAGVGIASALDDELVALDWFFGGELGMSLSPALAAGPNRRAIFHNAAADIAFMANWTALTFSRDIDAVVEAARAAAANQNVFLGGHSAGTGFTARYAATDFDLTGMGPADPGYAKLRGLVLLEGGGSSVATPPTSAQLDQIEDKADGGLFYAVRDQAPRCVDGTDCSANGDADCVGLGQGTCTAPVSAYAIVPGLLNPRILAAVEPGSIQARTDPDTGQVILQVDQGSGTAIGTVSDLATLALLPQATASGALGSFLDDDGLVASIASFVRTSVGAPGPTVGPLLTWQDIREGAMPASVIPDNGPAPTVLPGTPWGQEYEVTDLTRMQEVFVADGTNFTDWYYPQAGLSTTTGVGIDSTALSVGRGRRDIENLTQAANVDIPVIAFGGTNGLTPVPGSFTGFGQALGVCTAPSCDGATPRVVDASTPNVAFPTLGGVAGGYEVHLSEGFSHVDIVSGQDGPRSNVVAALVAFLARNVQ